jgi:hypothetical protein
MSVSLIRLAYPFQFLRINFGKREAQREEKLSRLTEGVMLEKKKMTMMMVKMMMMMMVKMMQMRMKNTQ